MVVHNDAGADRLLLPARMVPGEDPSREVRYRFTVELSVYGNDLLMKGRHNYLISWSAGRGRG